MNQLKTAVLLILLSSLLVEVSYLMTGTIFGALVGFLLAAGINLTAWFYSDQIALTVYGARKPDSHQLGRLQPMVERLSRRAQLPTPKIYVVPTPIANAFATGRDPEHGAIAVTQGLLALLPDDELEAVVAHELSHIKHRDTLTQSVTATIAGGITLLAELVGRGIGLGVFRSSRNPLGVMLMVFFAPLAATVIRLAISRTREFAADAGSATLTGNPNALAKALQRLEQGTRHPPLSVNTAFMPLLIINPLASSAINRWFSTHPPTDDRVNHLLALNPHPQPNLQNRAAMKKRKSRPINRAMTSAVIILAAFGLAYAPLPGLTRTIVIVSGTELEEPLQALEARFEQANPSIQLELQFQGSQDLVNNYIDDKNDFTPTVLIPANGELLTELGDRWRAQTSDEPFYDAPRPLAKTILVAIAWSDRGKALFPDGRFSWQRLEDALQKGSWGAIGGSADWGSFDFLTTDPTRSNSAQLALGLWAQSKLGGGALSPGALSTPAVDSLFALAKRSIYQPPRSTDVLLKEFITRGPNEADMAIVYESVALHRWQQSATTQGKPYQIYYIDPTVETVSTAAIVRRHVDGGTADAARAFLDFLAQPEQQAVFVEYGFRPVDRSVNISAAPNSPWNQNIPGAEVNPPGVTAPPDRDTLTDIIRLWQRAN